MDNNSVNLTNEKTAQKNNVRDYLTRLLADIENQKELYELNKKLASIVLPVQRMYKDLVSEITEVKGGQLFDIKA